MPAKDFLPRVIIKPASGNHKKVSSGPAAFGWANFGNFTGRPKTNGFGVGRSFGTRACCRKKELRTTTPDFLTSILQYSPIARPKIQSIARERCVPRRA